MPAPLDRHESCGSLIGEPIQQNLMQPLLPKHLVRETDRSELRAGENDRRNSWQAYLPSRLNTMVPGPRNQPVIIMAMNWKRSFNPTGSPHLLGESADLVSLVPLLIDGG